MTTYAPNFTPRWKGHYHAAGIDHTIMCRAPRGTTTAGLPTQAETVRASFSAMSGILASDFAWLGAEYALTDSDIFIPTDPPATVTGAVDVGDFSLKQRATSTNFNGKAAGSRAALYFYGILWAEGLGEDADNGRVTPAEEASLSTVITQLNAGAYANSGDSAIFHSYANVKVNDHFLKLLRRGTIT
jgi:hypothetical protein